MAAIDDAGILVEFTGFSPEAFKFLNSLKRNNRREWFKPRKEQYETLLQAPMHALLYELRAPMKRVDPTIRINPKKNTMRIYRDIRFSGNKAPYKTHIGAGFRLNPKRDSQTEAPSFYLHAAPGEIFIAGGLYQPSSQQLIRIRRAIDENPRPFLNIAQGKTLKTNFKEIEGTKLKRGPKGFPLDHKNIEFLKLKQFYLVTRLTEKQANKKTLIKQIATYFERMVPLMQWLDDTTNP